jgi:hypothetical protein
MTTVESAEVLGLDMAGSACGAGVTVVAGLATGLPGSAGIGTPPSWNTVMEVS